MAMCPKQINHVGAADRAKCIGHVKLEECKVRVTAPASIHVCRKLCTSVAEVAKLHICHRRSHIVLHGL
eukprot:1836765-Amphidinium_carterae.1